MLPELTQDEFSAALDAVAYETLLALAPAEPPVDAIALAGALGLSITWDDSQPGRGRVVRLRHTGNRAHGSIFLRRDPRHERVQWAVAHEIGETCAAAVFDRLGADPREAPTAARENVANQLAGRLLLPREWFALDGRRLDWDLIALKQCYATASHELIARRMLDFDVSIIISIFDRGRRTFRRANFPGRLPPLLPVEHECRNLARESAAPAELTAMPCRAQAWPIHEPGWQREILRTEWHADGEEF